MHSSRPPEYQSERGPVLIIDQVSKRFGRRDALRGISLSIAAGEIVGFVGLNGAGKTTTLRLTVGLLRPSSGRLTVLGRDAQAPVRADHIGALIDRPALYPHVTARNTLRMFGALEGMTGRVLNAEVDRLLSAFGATGFGKVPVRDLSSGMRQRLAIALAFFGQPPLVILDEPTDGLDPEGISALRQIVREEAAKGAAVFFSSHLLSEVETVATRVVMIHDGLIVRDAQAPFTQQAETVRIVLRTDEEFQVATRCLASHGWSPSAPDPQRRTLVVATEDSRDVNKALCSAGVFASAIYHDRASLEETFFRLARIGETGETE